MIDGQYANPARVVCFNTAEGWSRDASEDVADEIADRLAAEYRDRVPASLEGFLDRHGGRPAQLPLPLRGAA